MTQTPFGRRTLPILAVALAAAVIAATCGGAPEAPTAPSGSGAAASSNFFQPVLAPSPNSAASLLGECLAGTGNPACFSAASRQRRMGGAGRVPAREILDAAVDPPGGDPFRVTLTWQPQPGPPPVDPLTGFVLRCGTVRPNPPSFPADLLDLQLPLIRTISDRAPAGISIFCWIMAVDATGLGPPLQRDRVRASRRAAGATEPESESEPESAAGRAPGPGSSAGRGSSRAAESPAEPVCGSDWGGSVVALSWSAPALLPVSAGRAGDVEHYEIREPFLGQHFVGLTFGRPAGSGADQRVHRAEGAGRFRPRVRPRFLPQPPTRRPG